MVTRGAGCNKSLGFTTGTEHGAARGLFITANVACTLQYRAASGGLWLGSLSVYVRGLSHRCQIEHHEMIRVESLRQPAGNRAQLRRQYDVELDYAPACLINREAAMLAERAVNPHKGPSSILMTDTLRVRQGKERSCLRGLE